MREKGFSLAEVLMVMLIMSILGTIATLKFSEYARRSNKESQTRAIHAEIMQARLHSLTERRGRVVKFTRTSFQVYSSLAEKDAEPQLTLPLRYPIKWGGGGTEASVSIDDRGVVTAGQRSVCLEDVGDKTVLDSVVVSSMWVNLGSRNEGAECKSEGITVR